MTEKEFCQSRDSDSLGEPVEEMSERQWLRIHWEETWEGWDDSSL